ncbi:MAG: RNA methyltransferase [Candidatus Izemoplasmatales bacterium]|nr:RNA methyltransferase [Candidatus Izemoplasmatales bacterium]
MIRSLTNEKIKHVLKLKDKKYRQEYGEFVVEGTHLIEEAIAFGLCKFIFSLTENSPYPVETLQVSIEVMKKMSNLTTSPGMIAICSIQVSNALTDKILILDGVQDPGNLGTLIRSASAFGFRTILVQNSVDLYNPKVLRSTQGGIFKINYREIDIEKFMNEHQEIHFIGTDLASGIPFSNVHATPAKIALILGNEGSGVQTTILNKTAYNIKIEMQDMESINVGAAGSILMYAFSQMKGI